MSSIQQLNRPAGEKQAACAVERANTAQRWLRRAVDFGLLAALLVTPLLLGGRHAWGQLWLVAAACFAALSWTLLQLASPRPSIRTNAGIWLLCATVGILLVQVAPLPADVLQTVSSSQESILPAWQGQGAAHELLGPWSTISLHPGATRQALVLLLACGMLFFVACQHLRRLADVERLLTWLAAIGSAVAVLGLLQFAFGNGKFVWVYEHPYRGADGAAKGPFTNQNHFAQFLALGLGPLLWLFAREFVVARKGAEAFSSEKCHGRRSADMHRLAILAGLAATIAGVALSWSRGGLIATLAATAVFVALLARGRFLARRALVAGAMLVVAVAGVMVFADLSPLARRWRAVSHGAWSQIDPNSARSSLWQANVAGFQQFPVLGVGAGAHGDYYKLHYSRPSLVHYHHADNCYLQVAMETGAPGLTLLLLAIAMIARWGRAALARDNSPSRQLAAAAVVASLTASMVHAAVDFVWFVPACLVVTLALLACLARLAAVARGEPGTEPPADSSRDGSTRDRLHGWVTQKRPPQRPKVGGHRGVVAPPRWAFAVALVALAGAGIVTIGDRLGAAAAAPHWDNYLAISAATNKDYPDVLRGGRSARMAPLDGMDPEVVDRMCRELERVVAAQADHAAAHLRLAGLYLRRFDLAQQTAPNPFTVTQIRDAAVAARFKSSAELRGWLARAAGPNVRYLNGARHHAQEALRRAPCPGEVYLYMAKVAFLADPADRHRRQWVAQALRVRPHDGAVRIEAGFEAMLAGDTTEGIAHWRTAYKSHRKHRQKIIDLLVGRVPLERFIEEFNPDLKGLQKLYRLCAERGLTRQRRVAAEHYARAVADAARASRTTKAAELWRLAAAAYADAGQNDHAIQCLRAAVKLAPDQMGDREQLIRRLCQAGQYREAAREVDDCLRRQPNEPAWSQWKRRISFLEKRPRGDPNQTATRPAYPPTK